MQNLWTEIRQFITKDVKNESESKDLAILIRFVSISTFLFVLIGSIYFAFNGSYFHAIISLPFLGLYVFSFIISYENKTNFALLMFNYSTIAAAVLFSLIGGWDKNYQWMLIIVCLMIFFSTDIDIKVKRQYTEILIIILIAISVLSHLFGPYRTGNTVANTIFSLACAGYYGLSIALIAYSFSKKFNASELKLKKYNQKLQQMASLDTLTQLANRRSMNEYLAQLVFEKEKKGDTFCIAIADIDFFKKVNDTYGHEAGDFILKESAKIFEATMEGRGKVSRWGGEEFLFCFEDLQIKQAYAVLDDMRNLISQRKFIYKDTEINITVTIGLEEYYHIYGVEGTISSADKKLYNGKSNGRNMVVM